MKRRRRILTVAGLLMAMALFDFILLMDVDGEPMIIGIWRLFLTALLAFFLAMGKNSARWITIVLTGLGALGGFMGIGILVVSGNLPPGSGYVLVWMTIITLIYGGMSAFLAFSSGVKREIRRIAERISFPRN